jgi:hypothetical protein
MKLRIFSQRQHELGVLDCKAQVSSLINHPKSKLPRGCCCGCSTLDADADAVLVELGIISRAVPAAAAVPLLLTVLLVVLTSGTGAGAETIRMKFNIIYQFTSALYAHAHH